MNKMVNCRLIYISSSQAQQKHTAVEAYASTEKTEQEHAVVRSFLSTHANSDTTDGPQSD